MQAQALLYTDAEKFRLETVDLPALRPQDVLIRTLYSGVSVGTEFLLFRRKINWGEFPILPGYQGVGIIEETGSEVSRLKPGDRVYFGGSFQPLSWNGQHVSPTWGTHASYVVVDASQDSLPVYPLPEGIDPAVASLFVMPSVGLNAVTMAGVGHGDRVAVYGAGLIGLGAVAACALRGARVACFDINDSRLAVARKLAALAVVNPATEDAAAALEAFSPGGADVVLEASGNPVCVDPALALCKWRGKFVFLGNYGLGPLPFNFIVPHGRQLTAFFPSGAGGVECNEAVLRLMASGALPWHEVITHRLQAAEAPAFYEAVRAGQARDLIGAVIEWSSES
ncbi:MAG: zinc-dependent alcohol dehydrogenase [Armatimonadota bacterium]